MTTDAEQDDEIKDVLDGMPYVRRLVLHPESDCLFEIKTDAEWKSCAENGCEDVTGNEEFEEEFKEQQNRALHDALVKSGITELEITREFTVSRYTARRWLSGDNLPHAAMHRYVYDFLEKRKQLHLN